MRPHVREQQLALDSLIYLVYCWCCIFARVFQPAVCFAFSPPIMLAFSCSSDLPHIPAFGSDRQPVAGLLSVGLSSSPSREVSSVSLRTLCRWLWPGAVYLTWFRPVKAEPMKDDLVSTLKPATPHPTGEPGVFAPTPDVPAVM